MQDLGKLIDRARMQMSAGLPISDIRRTFENEGYGGETIYWALKGAQFERDHWNRIREASPGVKAKK